MAIQNKTVTLLGASAKVNSFTVYLQADGSYRVTIAGIATDGAAFEEQLAAAISVPSGVAVLDNMSARALVELRKANGLET
jgi:hypothetical protein